MKKEEFISELEKYFILKDGNIYLKEVKKPIKNIVKKETIKNIVKKEIIKEETQRQLLEKYSKNEIIDIFRNYGFTGYSGKKKDDIIDGILSLANIKDNNIYLKSTNQQINNKPLPLPEGRAKYGEEKEARHWLFREFAKNN
jgi:hypothetical protein